MVTSAISTIRGKVGPFVTGTIQELIPEYVVLGDETLTGTGGWYPGNGVPSAQFTFNQGTLYDAIGVDPTIPAWTETPVGDIFAVYSQQLRYVWRMSGYTAALVPVNQTFMVTLTTLQWVITKTSPDTFMVTQ